MILETILASFVLSILFGINNASVCQAGIVSGGLFSFRRASVIIGAGLLAGSILEGWKTKTFVSKTAVAHGSMIILLISILILLVFTIYKVPISVAHVVAGGWLGTSLSAYGLTIVSTLVSLVFAWALTPIVSFFIGIFLYLYLRRKMANWPLPKLAWFNRMALLLASFFTSYSLGSNNTGLILGVSGLKIYFLIIVVVGILIGSTFMSKKFVKAIGEDFLVTGPLGVFSSLISGSFVVWILTQFGYPASLTNGILGALVGIGFISKPRVMNMGKLYQIMFSWIFGGLIGFFLSYLAIQFF